MANFCGLIAMSLVIGLKEYSLHQKTTERTYSTSYCGLRPEGWQCPSAPGFVNGALYLTAFCYLPPHSFAGHPKELGRCLFHGFIRRR